MINKLTVLYDPRCGFCIECAHWLEQQNQLIELELIAADSPEARLRYASLDCSQELTVVDDQGGVYLGPDAWIMTLYALRDYRIWSLRLSSPILKPTASGAYRLFAKNRRSISALLGLKDNALKQQLQQAQTKTCEIA